MLLGLINSWIALLWSSGHAMRHRVVACVLCPASVTFFVSTGSAQQTVPTPLSPQSPTSVAAVAPSPVKQISGYDVLSPGRLTLDVASLPKAPGLFAAAYTCFVLEATAGSVWIIQTTATSSLQTVAVTILADTQCAEARTAVPLNGKFAFPVRLAGGAYVVHISSVGRPDPVILTTTLLTPAQALQLTDIVELGVGPIKRATPAPDTQMLTQIPPSAAVQSVAFADMPAGTVLRDCEVICPEMIVLPAGRFSMGSASGEEGRLANEGPRHEVALQTAFAFGRREVSFAEWDACAADGGCNADIRDNGWGRARRPVVNVTFADAQAYVAWLSKKTGQSYFLPSEAEWEYAARAGTFTPWHTGEKIISDDANILNQFQQSVPVGSFPPNVFGLFDMHGNVAEWTQDCEDIGYFGVPADGSVAISAKCDARMTRGGSFDSSERDVRSARRQPQPVTAALPTVGFRVARVIRPPADPSKAVQVVTAAPPITTAAPAPDPVDQQQPPVLAVATPVPKAPEAATAVSPQESGGLVSIKVAAAATDSPSTGQRMDVGTIRDTLEIVDRAAQAKAAAKPAPAIPAQPAREVDKTSSQTVVASHATMAPASVVPPSPVTAKPKPAGAAAKAPTSIPTAMSATTFAQTATDSLNRIRALRKQGLESIQRGNIDAAITLLRDAYVLAKGTDLSDLLSLDLERARKIKSGMLR